MGPTAVTARRVTVSGRVQGVFFRQTCRRMAVASGVEGWVRNRADGRVEAWFQGDAPAVESMVEWCRQGPPGAYVDGVEVVADEPAPVQGFRVR